MTQTFIRIKQGTYRNSAVDGLVFELVKGYEKTPSSSFVTVKNGGKFPTFPENIRIKVASAAAYEFVSGDADLVQAAQETAMVPAAVIAETDEEAIARIRERFQVLDEMTEAATEGSIRAMIVSGPPGVGKSFGVERVIEKAVLFDKLAGRRIRAEVIKGSTTAVGLYCTLYKYSDANSVLVFDDCDSVLLDDTSLNLLKGALDSGKARKISWLADSHMLRNEGVPNSFTFKGSVIFISNLKFDTYKGKLREHLDALQSRCHYLDLTLDTMRDKMMRVKQIAQDGELFSEYDFDQVTQDEIIEFMDANKNKLREVSLRMAVKLADLVKAFPLKWRSQANVTCMLRG